MEKPKVISEATILENVIASSLGNLSPEVARSLLSFKFDPATTRLIRKLLNKNNRGAISAEERITLEKYVRVGRFIDLLHARVRLSIQGAKLPQ